MRFIIIGTCAICLGPVQCPTLDGTTSLSGLAHCRTCNAKPLSTGQHGPTIIMRSAPSPTYQEPG